jgi:hypothetical protein
MEYTYTDLCYFEWGNRRVLDKLYTDEPIFTQWNEWMKKEREREERKKEKKNNNLYTVYCPYLLYIHIYKNIFYIYTQRKRERTCRPTVWMLIRFISGLAILSFSSYISHLSTHLFSSSSSCIYYCQMDRERRYIERVGSSSFFIKGREECRVIQKDDRGGFVVSLCGRIYRRILWYLFSFSFSYSIESLCIVSVSTTIDNPSNTTILQ